jgi:hypothetical protein
MRQKILLTKAKEYLKLWTSPADSNDLFNSFLGVRKEYPKILPLAYYANLTQIISQ